MDHLLDVGWIPTGKGAIFEGALRSIRREPVLFGRWQQRCGLSLSVPQQLVRPSYRQYVAACRRSLVVCYVKPINELGDNHLYICERLLLLVTMMVMMTYDTDDDVSSLQSVDVGRRRSTCVHRFGRFIA